MCKESRVNVLGVGISPVSMTQAVQSLLSAVQENRTGYVCVTSVHGVMESQRDPELKRIHNRSLLAVPDGMPTVWMGREYGFIRMTRVYGPDLMLQLLAATSGGEKRHSHFLYGSTEATLRQLKVNLETKIPDVQIVGSYAPPFRPLTEEEELDLQRQVTACQPDFFWVGLSTPKQEQFMAAHGPESGKQKLDAKIFIGVGAAFDIHAGNYKDAPAWIQTSGLQWLFRLCKEPRRLWRRYLWIVPGFIGLSFLQVMGLRKWTFESGE